MSAKQTKLAVFAVLVAGSCSPGAHAQPTGAGVSLTARPSPTVYGSAGVVFSGRVSGLRAGQIVSVLAQPCGFSTPHPVMTVKTQRRGRFTFSLQPGLNTLFSVRWHGAAKTVRVLVKPQVVVVHDPASGYRVDVSTTGGAFLDGQAVAIQSWNGSNWADAGSTTLAANSPPEDVTAVSSGSFDPPTGTKIRALLPATACYAAAASAAVQS
jgi:hypothetical protein